MSVWHLKKNHNITSNIRVVFKAHTEEEPCSWSTCRQQRFQKFVFRCSCSHQSNKRRSSRLVLIQLCGWQRGCFFKNGSHRQLLPHGLTSLCVTPVLHLNKKSVKSFLIFPSPTLIFLNMVSVQFLIRPLERSSDSGRMINKNRFSVVITGTRENFCWRENVEPSL